MPRRDFAETIRCRRRLSRGAAPRPRATPRQRATSLMRFPEILRRHLISAFGMIALAPALVRGRFTTPAVTLLFLNELRHALRNEVAHEIIQLRRWLRGPSVTRVTRSERPNSRLRPASSQCTRPALLVYFGRGPLRSAHHSPDRGADEVRAPRYSRWARWRRRRPPADCNAQTQTAPGHRNAAENGW
jgi:hypothetical protein